MKSPIEFFIDYLKLHKIDDNFYLVNRPTIHRDFLDSLREYEEYYNKINNVKH